MTTVDRLPFTGTCLLLASGRYVVSTTCCAGRMPLASNRHTVASARLIAASPGRSGARRARERPQREAGARDRSVELPDRRQWFGRTDPQRLRLPAPFMNARNTAFIRD